MFAQIKTFHVLVGMITLGFTAMICGCSAITQADKRSSKHDGVFYRNPRVYNVEYSFEIFPDPNKMDRSKDLKLWIPIPREWDSQPVVKITSIEPEPHGMYQDPEYRNPMLFWDFGKEPEKPSYKVHLKFRSEQYDVHSNIDPNKIGPYDKKSKDYMLYTRSTNTVTITDKVKELAKIAIADEKNTYMQAKRIYEFVREKMCYKKPVYMGKKISVKTIFDFPLIDPKTGQEYYLGVCYHQSMVFVALCRSVGIPARNVFAWWDARPWIRTTPENPEPTIEPRETSIHELALSHLLGFYAHGWAEVYLPNYGWIPVDPTFGQFGHSNINNKAIIITKGRDVQIDLPALQEGNRDYRVIVDSLHDGRAVFLLWGLFHAPTVKIEQLNHPDPFPADPLAEYMAKLYPRTEAEKNLRLYRRRVLRWIDENTRERINKNEALIQAYKKEPRSRYEHQAFVCHMLRKMVGDNKFSDIVETYLDLRLKSGEPVSTARFQKIAEKVYGRSLDWFFKQWIGYTKLPQLQLDGVTFSEDERGWHVRGTLHQVNEGLFRLPVELAIQTESETEHKILWLESGNTDFEFRTSSRPKDILVDPNNDILSIREMPPLLEDSSHDEIAFCTITDQNKADWYDWTPLHFAAQAGQTDVVEYLITTGTDVNAENIRGETPVQFAAVEGHKEIAKLLIAKGADTSLYVSARLGDLARVKSLIEDGADVNAKNTRGETPLHAAASQGHKEIAELLIAKRADVNTKTWDYPPLSWAIWNEDRDMIKLLVTNGADVNFAEDDWPFLHYLASNNDRELVELLLAYGAKLDVEDKRGRTAFRIAVSGGYRDLVEFLVGKGAAAPEFHLAACLGDLDRVKNFVEDGTDVDTKDELGWTPLYWAASTAQEEVAEFLINKGADVDIRTKSNRTPLHQAAWSGATKLVELLISKGVDSNARDEDDSTPLHWAAAGGHRNVVEFLIAKGAKVKAKEKSGNTPLHEATAEGHADVLEILFDHGADVNVKRSNGKTALSMAKEEGHTEIVELLRKYGAKE